MKGQNTDLKLFNLEKTQRNNIDVKSLPPSYQLILNSNFSDVDPFSNILTRKQFFNKFFNVVRVSYLYSFPKAAYGLYNITNPIYRPLTKEKINSDNSFIICKAEPVNQLGLFNITYDEIKKENVSNSVFIVKGKGK